MVWKNICFCHWRVPAHVLSSYVPPGWLLDTYAGEAWLSVVPFAMANVRARALPALPGFHYVPELNLRTYVRRSEQRAVLFFSLDAASKVLVYAARIMTGLPYFHADMSLQSTAGEHLYRSKRLDANAPSGVFSAVYQNAGNPQASVAGSIEAFLHERYYFVTKKGLVGEVIHERYQLENASIDIHENDLGEIINYEIPLKPDLCFYAELLDVRSRYGA